MNECEVKTAHLLKRAPGIKVMQIAGKAHFTLPMRMDQPPFDNKDVRMALKYGIDREEQVKAGINIKVIQESPWNDTHWIFSLYNNTGRT